jgi:DNA-binding PadR family transcriptional regulator
MRFLEPCLLLLLHKRAAHGYELAEHIKPFGFDVRQSVDSSLVYRTLRALESGGMSPPIGTRLPLLARPGACTI